MIQEKGSESKTIGRLTCMLIIFSIDTFELLSPLPHSSDAIDSLSQKTPRVQGS